MMEIDEDLIMIKIVMDAIKKGEVTEITTKTETAGVIGLEIEIDTIIDPNMMMETGGEGIAVGVEAGNEIAKGTATGTRMSGEATI
jgi:hypothetical protein